MGNVVTARDVNGDHRDPAAGVDNAPPFFGKSLVPHVYTFAGMVSTISRAYLNPDEAIKDRLDNARFMRNDISIMESLEARQRATALLPWTLEVDGPPTPYHKALQERLTRILKKTYRFTEYRRNLMEAIWFGKQGVQNMYAFDVNAGRRDIYINDWQPIQGDKLVFRQNDWRGQYPSNQVGVRVHPLVKENALWKNYQLEPTAQGLAIFLGDAERDTFCIHKHFIEDAAWEDPMSAGAIHGIGIRSRIYWTWFQKQELLALLMEYMERTALGFEVWFYPDGNAEGEAKMEKAARNRVGRRNIILFPRPMGADMQAYDVEHIEPGGSGAETMLEILNTYFGHQIKRYILGQTLTSEAAATGLGSGVAELHLQTMLDIVKYDATNLEETITREMLMYLRDLNDPMAHNVDVSFKIQTESPNVQEKLEAYQAAWNMGCKLKSNDVMDVIGATIPEDDDEVLANPQIAAAQQQMQMLNQQMQAQQQQGAGSQGLIQSARQNSAARQQAA